MMPDDTLVQRVKRRLRVKSAFKECLMGQGHELHAAGADVMSDLATYCHALRTTTMVAKDGHIDPIASAIAEGRRQVYLRILGHLKMNESSLIDQLEQNQ